MTDENTQDTAPSQVIEQREADASALGRGVDTSADAPKPESEAKPQTTRDSVTKAFNDAKAASEAEKAAKEAPKVDDKAETDAKEAKPLTDKTAEADKAPAKEPAPKADASAPEKDAGKVDEAGERQSEGRKHTEPPSRFLPEARAKWANTPNEIKAEMHRVHEEYETETRELRETVRRYEPIKQYDEMARQSGTTLDQALQRYVGVEDLLHKDPIKGIAEVLRNVGITPQQYAQHIMQNPQAHQPAPQAQQPQQQRPDPQYQQLSQELNSLKTELASAKVAPVVEQFAASRPDFEQLQAPIAEILKSGIVEKVYGTSLTTGQKLEQAYRMAGGGTPLQIEQPAPAPASPPAESARLVDPDGQKSIRGAPGAGQTSEPQRQFETNRAALKNAFAALR